MMEFTCLFESMISWFEDTPERVLDLLEVKESKIDWNQFLRISIPSLDFSILSEKDKTILIRQTLLIKRRILLAEGFPNGYAMWKNERGQTHEKNLRMAMDSNLLQLAMDRRGRLVGYLAAKPSTLDSTIAEITDFYVLPGCRGKSQGSPGKYLLSHTLEKLEECGFHEVFLGTLPELKQAVALYSKFGFRKRTELEHVSQKTPGNLLYTADKLTFEMVRKLYPICPRESTQLQTA